MVGPRDLDIAEETLFRGIMRQNLTKANKGQGLPQLKIIAV
jgi:hypothetical protein